MMLRVFIAVVLFVVTFTVQGQDRLEYDKIKLLNGSLIKGKIVEDKVGDYLKIMLPGSQYITFYYDELAWIKERIKRNVNYFNKSTGYFNSTEIGILIDRVEEPSWWWGGNNLRYNRGYFTAHTINGYRVTPQLRAGIGVGVDYYSDVILMPLYVSIRGDLFTGKLAPFYQLDFGTAWGWERDISFRDYEKIDPGTLFQPSIGLELNTYNNVSFYLSAGYKFQKIILQYSQFETFTSVDRVFKNLSLRFGVEF